MAKFQMYVPNEWRREGESEIKCLFRLLREGKPLTEVPEPGAAKVNDCFAENRPPDDKSSDDG